MHLAADAGGLAGAHDGRACVDDAGLLRRDLGDRRAEDADVVQTDRRDHGDRCVQDVRRVPATAEPHFDDADVDRRIREGRERHRRQQLEERHLVRVATVDDLDERGDVVVDLAEPLGGDRRPVESDALRDALQMR